MRKKLMMAYNKSPLSIPSIGSSSSRTPSPLPKDVTQAIAEATAAIDESSESENETEPARMFQRRVSTTKNLNGSVSTVPFHLNLKLELNLNLIDVQLVGKREYGHKVVNIFAYNTFIGILKWIMKAKPYINNRNWAIKSIREAPKGATQIDIKSQMSHHDTRQAKNAFEWIYNENDTSRY